MKTVKKNKTIKRVSDTQAESLTKKGWKYCPKSEWREKVRDAKPAETKKKVSKKKNERKPKTRAKATPR
jgi:hypothetical protein